MYQQSQHKQVSYVINSIADIGRDLDILDMISWRLLLLQRLVYLECLSLILMQHCEDSACISVLPCSRPGFALCLIGCYQAKHWEDVEVLDYFSMLLMKGLGPMRPGSMRSE